MTGTVCGARANGCGWSASMRPKWRRAPAARMRGGIAGFSAGADAGRSALHGDGARRLWPAAGPVRVGRRGPQSRHAASRDGAPLPVRWARQRPVYRFARIVRAWAPETPHERTSSRSAAAPAGAGRLGSVMEPPVFSGSAGLPGSRSALRSGFRTAATLGRPQRSLGRFRKRSRFRRGSRGPARRRPALIIVTAPMPALPGSRRFTLASRAIAQRSTATATVSRASPTGGAEGGRHPCVSSFSVRHARLRQQKCGRGGGARARMRLRRRASLFPHPVCPPRPGRTRLRHNATPGSASSAAPSGPRTDGRCCR